MSARRRAPARDTRPAASTSWDPLAHWYNGWVGEGGSEHHRRVAIPALLRLLQPQRGETILDVGCGQGVLAPAVHEAGARYVGIDASPRLIDLARRHHHDQGSFAVGDARTLSTVPPVKDCLFDAVVFLLSLQDMDPLEPVLREAAAVLSDGGRAVVLLTHPAFRVPRQSGWGWIEPKIGLSAGRSIPHSSAGANEGAAGQGNSGHHSKFPPARRGIRQRSGRQWPAHRSHGGGPRTQAARGRGYHSSGGGCPRRDPTFPGDYVPERWDWRPEPDRGSTSINPS